MIENFTYDAANDNRLATSQVVANGIPQPTITTQYAANGNISQKTDVGTYAYDAQKINAVTAITNQQSVGLNNQTVKYTAFLMPDTIKTGNMLAAITYGGDHQRRKMVVSTDCVGSPAPCTAGATLTRYYFGNYEVTIDHTQNDKQFETHTPNPRRG